MKKISLLLGTLGGAFAGYLFSNTKLRDELVNSKDAEAAAKVLGKHLQHDGKKLAKQVQEFVQSEEVQKNVKKAKAFTKAKMEEAKDEIQKLTAEGKKMLDKTGTKAKSQAKSVVKKATKVKKAALKRVKASTRMLS